MATEAGELIVKISADVSDLKTSLQQMQSNVQSLGVKTVAEGTLMADAFRRIKDAAYDFVVGSVKAFGEHEQAMTRLNILVGRDGAQAMEDFAQSMQRTTTFSDDQVLSLERQLSQYGIYKGSVKEATQALLNFAAITGVDLPEAGAMLAKAMSGQSRELKNYGIDVSLSATRSENLATVIKGLTEKFPDAAAAMRKTSLGAVDVLSNRFDDLRKRIGEDLMPVTKKFISWAEDAMSAVETLVNSNRKYNDTLADQKAKLVELVAQAKAQTANGIALTKQQQDEIKTLTEHIKVLEKVKKAKDEDKGATDREISSIRALKDEIEKLEQQQNQLGEITRLTITKNILAAQMELSQLEANEVALTQMHQLETQKRLLTSSQSWEANTSFSDQFTVKLQEDMDKNTAAWADMAMSMIDSFANSTAKMIVEGGKFSDVMKNLWKQLAEMVISQILRMIAEWMVFQAMTGGAGGLGGGFLGFGAEGGMINEPSMILGLRSGSTIIAGENGPEAFGPPGAMNSLHAAGASSGGGGDSRGGSSGGGDVHIHITGQFIDGNPAKWQRLVQEQIVPQLRRFSMMQPTGIVNRKRGAMS